MLLLVVLVLLAVVDRVLGDIRLDVPEELTTGETIDIEWDFTNDDGYGEPVS